MLRAISLQAAAAIVFGLVLDFAFNTLAQFGYALPQGTNWWLALHVLLGYPIGVLLGTYSLGLLMVLEGSFMWMLLGMLLGVYLLFAVQVYFPTWGFGFLCAKLLVLPALCIGAYHIGGLTWQRELADE